MGRITFFYRKSDSDIEETRKKIFALASENQVTVIDICLDDEPEFSNYYNDVTPALQIGPYRLKFPIDDRDVQIAMAAFKTRDEKNDEGEEDSKKKNEQLLKITPLEKFSFWLSNYYILFITSILILFVGIPFLAPVLMKTGHENGARVIYKTYNIFCHELAYRSYFLYGEQAFYPRELAKIPNMLSYEQVTGKSVDDINFARAFTGDEILGYKIAICERDIAIYGSLILSGLIFHFVKRKLKPLPWYFWVIFAILPVAFDGSSQLFNLGGNWPVWFPIRESTPLLRTITGALFGFGTAWYVFPLMEESMLETRAALARKLAIKKRLIKIETDK
jgi:uncharacterized membrane protein